MARAAERLRRLPALARPASRAEAASTSRASSRPPTRTTSCSTTSSPGSTTAEVRGVFDRLREELVPLIAVGRRRGRRRPRRGPFPEDGQRALALAVMTAFGFDHESFRLDTHRAPVLLVASRRRDIRVTTRYRERRPRVALQLHARDRPRALRARRQPGARAHAARVRLLVRRCTRARAGCGRTSSAARCRSAAGSTRSVAATFPDALGGVTLERLPPRDQPRAALVHPGRRRRGHLRHAHHPALRARAGADRRDALDRRPAGGLERPLRGVPRRRRAGGPRSASCRTSTGRAGCSATSRPTSSAT